MDKTLLDKIDRVVKAEVVYLRSKTPYDTGNLRTHGVTLKRVANNVWEIYVDESAAPYMPYTNEPWISPKWNGKQNPNEGWWNRVCEEVMKRMARILGAQLEKGEKTND